MAVPHRGEPDLRQWRRIGRELIDDEAIDSAQDSCRDQGGSAGNAVSAGRGPAGRTERVLVLRFVERKRHEEVAGEFDERR